MKMIIETTMENKVLLFTFNGFQGIRIKYLNV